MRLGAHRAVGARVRSVGTPPRAGDVRAGTGRGRGILSGEQRARGGRCPRRAARSRARCTPRDEGRSIRWSEGRRHRNCANARTAQCDRLRGTTGSGDLTNAFAAARDTTQRRRESDNSHHDQGDPVYSTRRLRRNGESSRSPSHHGSAAACGGIMDQSLPRQRGHSMANRSEIPCPPAWFPSHAARPTRPAVHPRRPRRPGGSRQDAGVDVVGTVTAVTEARRNRTVFAIQEQP